MTRRSTRRQFIAQAGARRRGAVVGRATTCPRQVAQREAERRLRRGRRPGRLAHRSGPRDGAQLHLFCRDRQDAMERRVGQAGMGEGRGLHRLAQDVRETRQGPERGLRRHAGPQPFCPLDDGRLHGHQLLYREAVDVVRAGSAIAGGGLRQESQGRHADGQPGPRRERVAPGLRVHQGRRHRRRTGVPHLDQPPDLAAGRRPAHSERPRAGLAGLGGVDRPGADASLRQRMSIIPSTGAASSISAPAPWATWPAIPPTASMRSWTRATRPPPSRSS